MNQKFRMNIVVFSEQTDLYDELRAITEPKWRAARLRELASLAATMLRHNQMPSYAAFSPSAVPEISSKEQPQVASNFIRVEINREHSPILVDWPINAAPQCVDWLRELLG